MSRDLQSRDSELQAEAAKPGSSEVPTAARETSPPAPRLIAPLDILMLIAFVVLTPVAWFLPQRLWPKLGRSFTAVVLRLMPHTVANRTAHIEQCLGPVPVRLSPLEILTRTLSREFEEILLILKCYRPDGWEPAVEVHGLEHLQTAAARGKGVVLWSSHFYFASLITKYSMYRAGFALNHLSHPRHGFSWTRFGMRFLNPVCTYAENRFLEERIYMGLDSAKAAVDVLRKRLLAGRVVSIAAREIARKPIRIPFLAGLLPLATGAPGLAQETQAALLTAHTLQLDTGAYVVIIDPPIDLDASLPRWIAGEAAAREYGRRLETIVREYPDLWLGWTLMETVVPE